MQPVTIYTKQTCPYCVRAKQLLETKGATFEEIRIDLQPQRREEMIERAGGRGTVPQIFIGATHVGGCDDLFALEAEGALDVLLAGN